MALTTAEKQTLLDELYRAYYSGALEVKYADQTIKYESGEALLDRIKKLEGDLAGSSQKKNYGYASFKRGRKG